jgi:hypothetical protein
MGKRGAAAQVGFRRFGPGVCHHGFINASFSTRDSWDKWYIRIGFQNYECVAQSSLPDALSLDGQDLDYEVRNAPGFFKLFTSMPSFLDKYQSARFFKYAPCFGVAAMGDAAQYSLAIWIKIIATFASLVLLWITSHSLTFAITQRKP